MVKKRDVYGDTGWKDEIFGTQSTFLELLVPGTQLLPLAISLFFGLQPTKAQNSSRI